MRLDYLYFPIDCIISLINLAKDRAATEVSVMGNEGVVGIPLFMGGTRSLSREVVQSAGSAYRLHRVPMQAEFSRGSDFMELLLRYTHALMSQIGQTAVCNRHHSIDQQLIRFLLHSIDRLPGNTLHMTQGLIAKLLGVRRERVTEAAGKLQMGGAIAYRRGSIEVIDRCKLEGMCCECYGVVKREYDRLLQPPAPAYSSQYQPTFPVARVQRALMHAPHLR